jgi:type IV pilus assembly protein PilC
VPYFVWKGDGRRRGCVYAADRDLCQQLLEGRGIRDCRLRTAWRTIFLPPVRVDDSQFFALLAVMLERGLRLVDALNVLSKRVGNRYERDMVESIALEVTRGSSLFDSLIKVMPTAASYPLLHAGNKSSQLVKALQGTAKTLALRESFKQQLRNALRGPLITLVFFMCIVLLLLVIVVPQFEQVFALGNVVLTPATSALFALNHFIISRQGIIALVALVLLGYSLFRLVIRWSLPSWVQRLLLRLPGGAIIRNSQVASFFRATSLALEAGIPLSQAMRIANSGTTWLAVREQLSEVVDAVDGGEALDVVGARYSRLFAAESLAMIVVGQESGTLALQLGLLASDYHDRIKLSLERLTAFVQPIVVLVLGALIALFMIAVYLPIFNMANVIGIR